MTRRLRLGVDLHTFDGIYQGSRSHLIGLYRAAIELAPDIDFLFMLARPDDLRRAYPEFARGHVQLITMPQRPGPWRLFWQLPALQRRYGLDLLHVQFRLPFFPSGECLCTIHDVLFETHPEFFSRRFASMARWSARRAVRDARVVLTVSDYSRQQIVRHYPIDAARIVMTPNAVDPERFHPRRESERSTDAEVLGRWNLVSNAFICTLGRLEPRKNHGSLVRAYAALSNDAPPLVIIGERDFGYGDVFAAIAENELTSRVRVLEDVDERALPVLLRHARLMAYPSRAEGFGMPALEALASGVPVITSDITALPETAGPAAWLVAPHDISGLTAALEGLLNEAAGARGERIRRGLDHAARFSWTQSAANLLAAARMTAPSMT